jgi:diguanylate cyclase (GGDEF)-like protein
VLFCDLDGFKAVNDRFGHAAGDALLVTVAQRISEVLRGDDVVARLGGDEFAVLLEDAEPRRAIAVCERLLVGLRQEVPVAGHDVHVSVSIGVALSAPGDDATTLLRNADLAMYHAKAQGKDRFAVYQPDLAQHRLRRLETLERLRHAVGEDRLLVHYQPLVDLATGRVEGVEALVRWDRDGTLVTPDAFVDIAEQSGLVVDLGSRVLDRVVADAPALAAAAGGDLVLGVNVSPTQLRAPGFVDSIRRAAAVAASSGTHLLLEMTEHVLIEHDEATAAILRDLADAGVRLAIDDFGVGFSSVGYLQRLPVDVLKIDKSFIVALDSDPRAAALVEAMVLMGAALGLTVVAEGVERRAQADALRAGGCHVAQGYLVSRPLPLTEVVALLRSAPGGVLLDPAAGPSPRPAVGRREGERLTLAPAPRAAPSGDDAAAERAGGPGRGPGTSPGGGSHPDGGAQRGHCAPSPVVPRLREAN